MRNRAALFVIQEFRSPIILASVILFAATLMLPLAARAGTALLTEKEIQEAQANAACNMLMLYSGPTPLPLGDLSLDREALEGCALADKSMCEETKKELPPKLAEQLDCSKSVYVEPPAPEPPEKVACDSIYSLAENSRPQTEINHLMASCSRAALPDCKSASDMLRNSTDENGAAYRRLTCKPVQYKLSRQEILQIQTNAWECGVPDVDYPSGVIGSKTKKYFAMRYEVEELPFMTKELRDKLISKSLCEDQKPQAWAAASVASDFSYGTASNYDSAVSAYDHALAGCRQRASNPGSCQTIVTGSNKDRSTEYNDLIKKELGISWIVAVRCPTDKGDMMFIVTGSTRDDAVDRASEYSKGDEPSAHDCRVIVAIDGLGEH